MSVHDNIDKIAYMVSALGTLADHLVTRIGLLNPRITEFNGFTVILRRHNLWLFFDIFVLMVSLVLPYLIYSRSNIKGRWAILVFPLLFGIARLGATVHNIFVILLMT